MTENKHRRPVVIGVTGGSGSGKTTVSKAIYNQLSSQSLLILQQDSYYNDRVRWPWLNGMLSIMTIRWPSIRN